MPLFNFMGGPPYTHCMEYPHVASIDLHQLLLVAWSSPYNSPPEECSALYPGQSSAMDTVSMNDMTSTPATFSSRENRNLGPVGYRSCGDSLPAAAGRSLFPKDAHITFAFSPNRSYYSLYAWMCKAVQVTGEYPILRPHTLPFFTPVLLLAYPTSYPSGLSSDSLAKGVYCVAYSRVKGSNHVTSIACASAQNM